MVRDKGRSIGAFNQNVNRAEDFVVRTAKDCGNRGTFHINEPKECLECDILEISLT